MLRTELEKVVTAGIEDRSHHFLREVLRDYQLVELIGEGTFSLVVKAKRGDQVFAIKFMDNIYDNEVLTRSFIREVSILR